MSKGMNHAIATKAGIVVDHFLDKVIARRKVGGEARAMMAADGIERAIDYWRAINAALAKRGSPYKAIIAFSGSIDDAGEQRTEASFNGFPSSELEDKFDADPYRFLVVADKYLTGFDQPKLFAMYVDKTLAGVKAVQALSRLNRARPGKTEPFVLDFRNDPAVIEAAFSDFYRTTILSGETDPNKLHDLKRALDEAAVYTESDVESIVSLFLQAAPRDQIDPILDACSAQYEETPRRRPDCVQGRGQGVRSDLCVPRCDPAICGARVGEVVLISHLADPQTAQPHERRNARRCARNYRHGQLSGGGRGGHGDRPG
jgi:type I restriction enzyme, R subunit